MYNFSKLRVVRTDRVPDVTGGLCFNIYMIAKPSPYSWSK